ncbi:MAG: DUF1704 domain-containing protein [Ktedonobacteraceae bacterium]|nr:DUF1704 domain-containing protein [Ktedonobacteraceae bacterium]
MFAQEDVLEDIDGKQDFGSLLKVLRVNKRVKQIEILAQLPGWTPSMYVRLENGEAAPAFDQLLPIYRAFQTVGISFPLSARHQFVERARSRIDGKKTYRDQHSDAEWAELRYQLTRMSSPPDTSPAPAHVVTRPLLAETAHLVGREDWREELMEVLTGTPRAKLVIISGPAGVGKSSELNWLASYLLYERPFFSRLILCDFRAVERLDDAQAAFEVFVGSLLAELGLTAAQPQTPPPTLDEQASRLLSHLEHATQPMIVLLDHAECLLVEQDVLASCWQRFFTRFLRSQHSTTLVLATNRWAGWYNGEQRFVAHHELLPLSVEKGVLLLQQSGLDSVPVWLLEQVCQKVGGIPLCLEWVTALVKQPLVLDDWDEFGEGEPQAVADGKSIPHQYTQAVQRLLAEPHIFGGSLADAIAPILERIIATQCLSVEAQALLHVLAVATLPLAKPGLKVLCPQGPRPIKELRNACMLVAYLKRTQLLPLIASAVYRQFSPEQRQEQETLLIQAYSAWVQDGTFQEGDSEQGAVITELAVLLLKHHRLVEAAEHVIRYGWISFNLGHGPRLARLAKSVMQRFDWHATAENECAGILLHYFLSPFIGEVIDYAKRYVEYQYILNAVTTEKIVLHHATEVHIIHHMMFCAMLQSRFEEAQTLFEGCYSRLEPFFTLDVDLETDVLEERASLLSGWSAYLEQQGEAQQARSFRDQCIAVYRQCCDSLTRHNEVSSLQCHRLMKRLAAFLNNLAYHLNRNGQFAEALQAEEQSITLKEQGYRQFGGLAASYGEKSQILAGLGRFREALQFDEMAIADAQQSADANHTFSQEDLWIYYVNRGRLYLRLGRVEKAELLLQEALSQGTDTSRRSYRMFAKEALDEIDQWRRNAASSRHQFDWRWVERYRELEAYDAYWWWAQAGPFTEQEQQQWDQFFTPNGDETTKEQLGRLIVQSRQRELAAAIAEQRQPHLHYPALDIQAVRAHIAGLLALDEQIGQQEPNAIVRRLYHGAIEDEVCFLRLFAATYEGDTDRFWELTRRLHPEPTLEEMNTAIASLRRVLLQGLLLPVTADLSQRVHQIMVQRLHLKLDLSCSEEEKRTLRQALAASSAHSQQKVTAQAAKRFFEAVLRESRYEGWQVVIDPKEGGARVEPALRLLFVPDEPILLEDLKHLLAHELAGHVARSFAGEHSALGLLGINTKNYEFTEEGLALYHERQVTTLHGGVFDDFGVWIGTLAIGLACGVLTPPQTFLSLLPFFESLSLLMRLLDQPDQDVHTVQEQARKSALTRSLRLFRGVPDLERAGICPTKDVVYLRGLQMIDRAVAQDETLLDHLAVGKISLQQLSELEELGMNPPPQPLRQLAYAPNLDAYILSFDREEQTGKE